MKRLLPLILALVMCLGLTGCLSQEEQQSRKLALELVNGTSTADYALSTGTAFEGRRIYEDNSGLIIYLAGITGTPQAPQLVLAVKNGTGKDLSASVLNLTYDNWMADGWMEPYDFPSHSATMATLCCEPNFSLLNLSDIHTMSFDLEIYLTNHYDHVATVSVDLTLGDEEWEDNYTIQGIPLMDSHDVLITGQALKNISDEAQATFYIDNQSDRPIRVESSHVTLNETAVELFLWDPVAPNARRMLNANIREIDSFDPVTIQPDDVLSIRLQISDLETGSVLDEVNVTLRASDFLNLDDQSPAASADGETDASVP